MVISVNAPLGMNEYLTKPVTVSALRQKLQFCLDQGIIRYPHVDRQPQPETPACGVNSLGSPPCPLSESGDGTFCTLRSFCLPLTPRVHPHHPPQNLQQLRPGARVTPDSPHSAQTNGHFSLRDRGLARYVPKLVGAQSAEQLRSADPG